MEEDRAQLRERLAGCGVERDRPKPARVLPVRVLVLVPQPEGTGKRIPERQSKARDVLLQAVGEEIEDITAPGESAVAL